MGLVIFFIIVAGVFSGCVYLERMQHKEIKRICAEAKIAEKQRELKYSVYDKYLCKDCENMLEADGEVKCLAWERNREDLLKGKWTEHPTCEECRENDKVCGKRGYTFKGKGKHYVKPLYYWRVQMYNTK